MGRLPTVRAPTPTPPSTARTWPRYQRTLPLGSQAWSMVVWSSVGLVVETGTGPVTGAPTGAHGPAQPGPESTWKLLGPTSRARMPVNVPAPFTVPVLFSDTTMVSRPSNLVRRTVIVSLPIVAAWLPP